MSGKMKFIKNKGKKLGKLNKCLLDLTEAPAWSNKQDKRQTFLVASTVVNIMILSANVHEEGANRRRI